MRRRPKHRAHAALAPALAANSVQTTLRLPTLLYERAKAQVESGGSRSVNELVSRALKAYLQAMERRAIDEAFRPMADDPDYQQEAMQIAEQFAASDAEALRLSSVRARRRKAI